MLCLRPCCDAWAEGAHGVDKGAALDGPGAALLGRHRRRRAAEGLHVGVPDGVPPLRGATPGALRHATSQGSQLEHVRGGSTRGYLPFWGLAGTQCTSPCFSTWRTRQRHGAPAADSKWVRAPTRARPFDGESTCGASTKGYSYAVSHQRQKPRAGAVGEVTEKRKQEHPRGSAWRTRRQPRGRERRCSSPRLWPLSPVTTSPRRPMPVRWCNQSVPPPSPTSSRTPPLSPTQRAKMSLLGFSPRPASGIKECKAPECSQLGCLQHTRKAPKRPSQALRRKQALR